MSSPTSLTSCTEPTSSDMLSSAFYITFIDLIDSADSSIFSVNLLRFYVSYSSK